MPPEALHRLTDDAGQTSKGPPWTVRHKPDRVERKSRRRFTQNPAGVELARGTRAGPVDGQRVILGRDLGRSTHHQPRCRQDGGAGGPTPPRGCAVHRLLISGLNGPARQSGSFPIRGPQASRSGSNPPARGATGPLPTRLETVKPAASGLSSALICRRWFPYPTVGRSGGSVHRYRAACARNRRPPTCGGRRSCLPRPCPRCR